MAKKWNPEFSRLLLENIGLAVLECQLAERVLSRCLVYALPQDARLWFDRIARLQDSTRRATLGRLQTVLGQRYTIANNFADQLDAFVQARNQLAHNLLDLPGFSLETNAGLARGIEFTRTARKLAKATREALGPVECAWLRAAGDSADLSWWSQFHATSAISLAASISIAPRASTPNKALQPGEPRAEYSGKVEKAFSRGSRLSVWMANYQIALNSGVSMSDTIPPCATSSSFSFM